MKKKVLVSLGVVGAVLFVNTIAAFAVDLVNYSARSYVVGEDSGAVIEGFVVVNRVHKMLIRAKGPSLPASFDKRLSDPVISVYKDGNFLISNDDWVDGPNSTEIVNTGLAPGDSKEPALIQLFEPGTYTVVVSGKGVNEGLVLLEIYDLGEASIIYDDFSGDSVNLTLWHVDYGEPFVRDGYFYCRTNQFVGELNIYACRVRTLVESASWGMTVEAQPENIDGNLGMQMCVGVLNGLNVCGVVEIQKNGSVLAKVVGKDNHGVVYQEFFAESLSNITTASFLGITWSYATRSLNFLDKPNGSSVIRAITWFGNNIDSAYQKAPLEIYSVSASPVTTIFPIAYVER